MTKFRKRPVVVEAMQFDGTIGSASDIMRWSGCVVAVIDGRLVVPTLEGDMTASTGDWIIKGIAGEFYPCKPEIFAELYEEVGDD